MSKPEQTANRGRRNFLKLASASAPAVVAAVALSGTEAEAAAPAAGETLLQDTDHTRAYFASARF